MSSQRTHARRGLRGRPGTLTALMVGALVATFASACGGSDSGSKSGSGGESKSLVIAGWGGSFTAANKEAFYDQFEKETGIKVTIATPGGGFAAKVAAQRAGNNIEWDLLEAPGGDTSKLVLDGNLEKFPASLVQAVTPLVADGAIRPSPAEPYYLDHGGTVNLIGCNTKLVKKCPTNPREFFDVKSFPGTRGITANNPIFTSLFGLAGDGVQPQQYFPADVDRAMNSLKRIKPNVSVWATSPAQMQQAIVDGEVAIMQAPNTVLISAMKSVPELKLYWEGGLLFDEGWCVPKGAKNKEAAFKFIQWYAEKRELQAKFTTKLGAGTAGRDMEKYLSPEVLKNLPINKAGVTLVDGMAGAKQQQELGKRLREILVG
ncbi:putative spermidine/putrescine transport system substrate-binding protein [Actinomadura pelletieri DSM 43383]|uniref:Putative spermidine/putrescine transport system substrate-binding protein n=1 Tax=Actinomadura pelletieri DSM 43383 TaxID=1120940 RepID=A0A495QAD2_9ACTN|nr:extracellular solute-binding protein [Actinomadura pelletieri]RKS68367.1 putative spermidine/putrescine transport system substrate-binding protein [Actinomadura pelletieri DSM 43383]